MVNGNPRELSDAERCDWLRLIRTENIGPVTFHALLARYGSVAAALEALPDLARRGGRRRAVRIPGADAAEAELAAIDALGGRAIAASEPAYPPALAALEDAPPLIFVLGRCDLLTQACVGVVGARNASGNGRRLARELAAGLGSRELVVISGLARGIDAAAHQGALDSGTIAVVAGGADVIYPQENGALYEIVKERGVILSEMPLGTQPQARHFPRRNRLISGLSLGVVVVEAALRSGSLITARYAADQGREVFAVPGSPLDPRARGCNRLIREGAGLVENADDIADALQSHLGQATRRPETPGFAAASGAAMGAEAGGREIDSGRASVLELLGPHPVAVDELVRQCQLTFPAVATALLELELAGRLERHPGNRVAMIYQPPAPGA